MSSCLFCRIVNGEIPAKKVHEDDRLIAFEDINPQAPMHVLVVPRAHIATLNDMLAEHDALVGSMVRLGSTIAGGTRLLVRWLQDGHQLQRRRRTDGVSPALARAGRAPARLAAGLTNSQLTTCN
jgi:histidine triad (HIT) family protein